MFPGFGLILIVALVVVVIWLLAGNRSRTSAGGGSEVQHRSSETPLEILQQRYARGEVTKEEYESIKKDLES